MRWQGIGRTPLQSLAYTSIKARHQIAAEETQAVIVAAAARLFFERGYQATSVAQIGAEAGVAVQTIYNSLGSKRDVLEQVLELAASDELATPDPDPGRIVDHWRGALASSARAFKLIRDAGAVEPAIAELERKRGERRLAEYETAAHALEQRGLLREGLTVRRAAATMFAIGHPEIYRELVLDGPWDDTLWATWARSTLKAALLEPPPS
jgi:AcrR family transcriptional regulator